MISMRYLGHSIVALILVVIIIAGVWIIRDRRNESEKVTTTDNTLSGSQSNTPSDIFPRETLNSFMEGLVQKNKEGKIVKNSVLTDEFKKTIASFSGAIGSFRVEDPSDIIRMFDIGRSFYKFRPLTLAMDVNYFFDITPDQNSLEGFIYNSARLGKDVSFSESSGSFLPIKNQANLSLVIRWLIRTEQYTVLANIWPAIKNITPEDRFAMDFLAVESFYNTAKGIELSSAEKEAKFVPAFARFLRYENTVLGKGDFKNLFAQKPEMKKYYDDVNTWISSLIDGFDANKTTQYIQEGQALAKKYEALPPNFLYTGRDPFLLTALLLSYDPTAKNILSAKEYLKKADVVVKKEQDYKNPKNIDGIPYALEKGQKSVHIGFLLGAIYLSEGKNQEAMEVLRKERDESPFDNMTYLYHRFAIKKIKNTPKTFDIWTPVK